MLYRRHSQGKGKITPVRVRVHIPLSLDDIFFYIRRRKRSVPKTQTQTLLPVKSAVKNAKGHDRPLSYFTAAVRLIKAEELASLAGSRAPDSGGSAESEYDRNRRSPPFAGDLVVATGQFQK